MIQAHAGFGIADTLGYADMHRGTDALFGFDMHEAVHVHNKALYHSKAQTYTAYAPCPAGIGLIEIIRKVLQLLAADTYTGILYLYAQVDTVITLHAVDLYIYAAFFGELKGIVCQMPDYL